MPGYVLAFDTAMGGCSVAVLDTRTGVAVQDGRVMERGQSEILVPLIQEIVRQAGCTMADLGLVVATVGPGGFTGLRIGLSTARSFGLALAIPVAGLRTTDVLLRAAKEKLNDQSHLLVVVETKREDFYVQEPGAEPGLRSFESLLLQYKDQPVTLCGDGVIRLQEKLGQVWPGAWRILNDVVLPDPAVMAKMGVEDMMAGTLRAPDPVYLRDADVSQSKRVQRVIAE